MKRVLLASLVVMGVLAVAIPPVFAQPCSNAATNIQGSHNNKATQIQKLENRCTVNIITGSQTPPPPPPPPPGPSQPIANAGPDQTISPGTTVTLNGAGSFTPNPGATIVSYSWVQTSGTAVSLNGANTATPTFTAPSVRTSLSFSLTVTDSTGAVSNPSTVTITVT